jgi:hypothetical protein
MFHALVFAAIALVIFGWTKNLGTEEAIAFRLEGPVINRLRFFYFSEGTLVYLLRRGERETNGVET